MKTILYSLLLFTAQFLTAQTATKEQIISDLPEIEITKALTCILFHQNRFNMWIYLQKTYGRFTTTNIARIKITDNPDVNQRKNKKACFIFKRRYCWNYNGSRTIVYCSVQSRLQKFENLNMLPIFIFKPEDMQPIEFDKMVFSNLELRKFAMDIIQKKSEKNPIRKEKNLKLNIQLNNVYVMSDYIFLDMTLKKLQSEL
jgi:hypothetical protein